MSSDDIAAIRERDRRVYETIARGWKPIGLQTCEDRRALLAALDAANAKLAEKDAALAAMRKSIETLEETEFELGDADDTHACGWCKRFWPCDETPEHAPTCPFAVLYSSDAGRDTLSRLAAAESARDAALAQVERMREALRDLLVALRAMGLHEIDGRR